MTARFVAMPCRYSGNAVVAVTCSPERAELWTVVEDTGAVVCRCDTQDMAARVAAGMDALAAVDALRAEREACRQAACFALGTDCETLEAAIEALVAGRSDAIRQLMERGQ